MIERIDGAPEGVVALRAVGEVTAADYDTVLKPAMQAAIAAHGKVRLAYELGPDFTGYSGGAAWEDLKFGTEYLTKWERCAVITDHKHLGDAVRAFGVLMPGEIRVFPVAQRESALAWAAG
jgi:hypothetical protein